MICARAGLLEQQILFGSFNEKYICYGLMAATQSESFPLGAVALGAQQRGRKGIECK